MSELKTSADDLSHDLLTTTESTVATQAIGDALQDDNIPSDNDNCPQLHNMSATKGEGSSKHDNEGNTLQQSSVVSNSSNDVALLRNNNDSNAIVSSNGIATKKNLGLLHYMPICCQNIVLSPCCVLFFLCWASTMQVCADIW